MSQPTRYSLSYDFTGFQSANPNTPLPADKLEIEFINLERTTGETITNLGLIQRSDGKLNNGIVEYDSLSNSTKALLGTPLTPRGDWAQLTDYKVLDLVTVGDTTYIANTSHSSGTNFTADLVAGRWQLWANPGFVDGTSYFQKLSGNGSQTVFTLSQDMGTDENGLIIFINNSGWIPQDPNAFTVNGTALTFNAAPPNGSNNIYIFAPAKLLSQAAAYATAASGSATNAASSASSASSSASAASTSASSALASQNAAETAADIAVAAAEQAENYFDPLTMFNTESSALLLPKGTTAERPVSVGKGMIRYNEDTDKFEGYGDDWKNIGTGSAFKYVYDSSNPQDSLLNYQPSEINEIAFALSYYPEMTTANGLRLSGLSVWQAYSLTGGSIDNTNYDSSNGFTVEGQYARWRLIQQSSTDVASVGVKADGETFGQITRLERLINATSLNRGIVTGQGVLMVDSQIDSTDCFLHLENMRLLADANFFGFMSQIKGGASAKDAGRLELQAWGTPQGAWGVQPLSVKRSIVLFEADTDTVTDVGHGRANGSLVRFEARNNGRTSAGSGMPDGVSTGTWYRVKNATTDTYTLGTLADNSDVAINTDGTASITAYYGGKRIVSASVASPTVISDVAHGLSTGDYKAFYSTGTLPTGIVSGCYYKVVVVDDDSYTLQSILTDAAINVTVAGTGTLTVDGRELEWQNVNEGTTAFRVFADSSASSSYKLHASYAGKGVVLEGNTEKEKIEVHGVGCDEILSEISTKTSTVTLSESTDKILWTNHGLLDMYVVQFGGTLPPEIFTGRKYKVINKTTNDFQISELHKNTPITFSTNGSGTITCTAENGSSGGSADTNKIEIIGTRCRRLFTSGVDNTSRVELNFESPVDLGRRIVTTDGVVLPDPRIMIRNGKNSHLSGNLRTHNGSLYILVDREGTNALDGSDTLHIDNLRFTDNCYGTLLFARRVQRLMGRLYARNSHNARVNMNDTGASSGVGNIPCPTVHIGQVYGGDFGVTLVQCDGREGLRIGDAANNLYPRNWDMGSNTVIMHTFNPRTGVYPTTMNALVIEKMIGGTVPFDQIEGNIRLEAGCSNVTIDVPAIWMTRYSLSADAAATASIKVRGSVSFSDIAYLPWLRSGIDLVVESLSDYGGSPARYKNGKWEIPGYPLSGVTSDFASISHAVNQLFKRKGLTAYDGSRLLVASGDAASDPWTHYDGSNGNTIGYQAATDAFVARMSTAPSTARKNVYDKLYYDLSKAGLLSGKLILLYILGAHEEATALLNLVSTSYNLTKNGSPIFTLNRGFTGTGLDTDFLATGYDATVTAEGMGQNDAHVGVFGLTESSSGEMIGSTNQRMSARISAGGSNRTRVNVTSNVGWTSANAAPRHALGNRVASGTHTAYDNGVLAGTSANASNGLPDAINILKYGLGATTGQVFAAHLGKGLTDTEIANLYSALRNCYNGILAT